MCKGNGCCGVKGMCVPALIAKILVLVGAVNWGLVGVGMLMGKGLEAWNVVHLLLGSIPTLEAIVYVLVGVAAVTKIVGCKCHKCKEACASCEVAPGAENKV